jgi:nucleoside 2-deoxyribosyltransferase
MKVFVAHKYRGLDLAYLDNLLDRLSDAISCDTFVLKHYEKQNNVELGVKEAMPKAFEFLRDCDFLFAVVDGFSEGQLLEIGFAKGSKKKVVLAMKEKNEVLQSLADEIIWYEDLEDLINKLKLFKWF